jgi:hypothetical protein
MRLLVDLARPALWGRQLDSDTAAKRRGAVAGDAARSSGPGTGSDTPSARARPPSWTPSSVSCAARSTKRDIGTAAQVASVPQTTIAGIQAR